MRHRTGPKAGSLRAADAAKAPHSSSSSSGGATATTAARHEGAEAHGHGHGHEEHRHGAHDGHNGHDHALRPHLHLHEGFYTESLSLEQPCSLVALSRFVRHDLMQEPGEGVCALYVCVWRRLDTRKRCWSH